MSAFAATNGIEVTDLGGKWGRSTIQFEGKTQNVDLRRTVTFEDDDLFALRERDLAQRDEDLDRWRWPDNPDYVVYAPADFTHYVRVLEERAAILEVIHREHLDGRGSLMAQAARAYFEAHPEAKPWQDAKPGEVWVLTLPDEGDADAEIVTVATTYGTFTAGSLREWTLNDDRIISARQVPTGGAA